MNHWLAQRAIKEHRKTHEKWVCPVSGMEHWVPKKSGNARFLAEAREIEARWEKTGLLKGLENDRFIRGCTAKLLESQRLVNEMVPPEKVKKERVNLNYKNNALEHIQEKHSKRELLEQLKQASIRAAKKEPNEPLDKPTK